VRASRLLLVVLGAGLGLVAASGIALWVALPALIEREVARHARDQGVALSFGSLDFGWNWAELKQVKVTLLGVDGITLAIDRLDANLDIMRLVRLDATGIDLEATGSLPALGLALGAWSKRYPSAFSLPLVANGLGATWRPDPAGGAWLELAGGSIASTPAGSILTADHVKIAAIDVGRVGATWIPTATSVALGLGESDLSRAPLRVLVDLSAAKPKVAFALTQTPLEKLAGPLAVALPVHGVSVGASAGFEFASRDAGWPEQGAAHAELHGWIPPHPAELDGFVFGDTTTVETHLTFTPDGKSIVLTGTRLSAGKFVLEGGGSVARTPDATTLALDLGGALPCDALASAAAESRVGRLLGHVPGARAGSVARQAIGGSVAVRVQVAATTTNLAGASLKRSIGIGCGLKPLTLDDAARLGETLLPSDLSEFTSDVQKLTPKLPDGTPLIPSALFAPAPLPPTLKIPSIFPPPG
jgi:hypothetical protein